ncbi:MAG: carbohydrate ABC transporter permease [Spirochaetaceae bacterium]|nr:carbohydrate ABC transporter permease [Spirochaetaceae bacterium]
MALRTTGERVFGVFNGLFLILFSVTILFPFVNLLAVSLTHGSSAYLSNVMLWPRPFSTKSYAAILGDNELYMGYLVTIARTVAGTFATVLVLLGAAYALSKKYLPHRNFYTWIFVFTLFFHGGLIPTYIVIRSLGLINKVPLVFVLTGLAPAFWLLIMRNFLMTIPTEIEDSARIDGANEIVTLFRIIAPMSMPVIATIGLWSAVGHWNAWFDSLLYVTDRNKHVLQIWLQRIVITANDTLTIEAEQAFDEAALRPVRPETLNSAAIFVAMAPILMVYPFVQKYFVKGVIIGSLKG